MSRVRALLTLVALVPISAAVLGAGARAASAQPVDPYAPSPPGPAAPAPAQAPAGPPPPSTPPAPSAPGPVSPSPGPAAPAPAPAPSSEAPQDPYAVPPGQDPVLAERVAEALVVRAQQLLDGRVFLDAKQLAVEALVKSPRGAAAEKARAIIRAANQGLGIPADAPRSEPAAAAPPAPTLPPARPTEDVDTSPIQDPTVSSQPVAAPAEGRPRSSRIAATVHGGLYAGLLGTTLGSLFSSDTPAAGAVPLGIAGAAGGGIAGPMLADRMGWTEAQVRTIGTATVWGGAIGGLFGDIADLDHTTARQVLIGATLGSTVTGLAGYALARDNRMTRGDVALIDTLAGIGGAGGLALGMLMQPAHTEAYSLNAVLGITGGVITGYIAAPMTNTTPRRMLRVAGIAAAGGAAPFLLYAAIHSPTTTADERVTGLLSTGGLIAGAWLGFWLTRGMDEGLDTVERSETGGGDPDGSAGGAGGKAPRGIIGRPSKGDDDAPVALVGRSSSGRWGIGGLGIAPLSPALAPQRGLALQLVGAAF